PEALLGRVAAEGDFVFDRQGEVARRLGHPGLVVRSNRGRGARDERALGLAALGLRQGLTVDPAVGARVLEHGRDHRVAGLAVDAVAVHEERSGDVVGIGLRPLGHASTVPRSRGARRAGREGLCSVAMKLAHALPIAVLAGIAGLLPKASRAAAAPPANSGRTIAITIDDLPINGKDEGLAALTALNDRLLAALKRNAVPAVGFVNESKLYTTGEVDGRIALLRAWVDQGLELGNHTY